MPDDISTQFFVNDQEVKAQVPADLSLVRFLRDYLNLTGTKNGCGEGHCGTCTVIVEGKAVQSCQVPMSGIKIGARVETVEGLAKGGELHPLQYAFVVNGGVQCGFCTPGMLMRAKALLDENPRPTTAEIKTALNEIPNLCRCTGYINIVKSIQMAAEMLAAGTQPPPLAPEGLQVQSTQIYREALKKVKGETQYGADLHMEGMMYGKVLWAAHPHAQILNIDTSVAEAMEGVVCVVTARDLAGTNATGIIFHDQPGIAADMVRFVGDHLACVFAESEEIAAIAVKKIKVDYRVLPGVFSPEEAAKADAPKVHKKGNLCHHCLIERGDVDEAFNRCEIIVDRSYRTPHIEHGFLEPEAGVAFKTEDGGVTLLLNSEGVFDIRQMLVKMTAMPPEKIRVVQTPQGGSFGGRIDPIFEIYLVMGALLTGRPAKIVLTREESLRVHNKRHPAWIHYKTGADKDGNILAVELQVTTDAGAYTGLSIDVIENMVVFGAGPYYVPNLRLDGKTWFTNNVPCGAMRGFGVNQVVFGLEQNIDDLARALKIDPFMFRQRNAQRAGMPSATDHVLEDGMPAEIETVQAAYDAFSKLSIPTSTVKKKIGVGVASAMKNIGFGHSVPESAGTIIELESNGDLTLKITHHEYGQGAHAGELQLLINELGVPVERVKIVGPDTAQTLQTGSTTASRHTFLHGNATVMACRALKEDLFARAAEVINEPPDQLKLQDDHIVHPETGKRVKLAELGERFVYERVYTGPQTSALNEPGEKSQFGQPGFKSKMTHYGYSYNTQVVVVEVDTESGDVKVLTVISANDVGKALNPGVIEGQIHGGVVMGIGYALTEEMVLEKGWNITDTLKKYGLPSIAYMPDEIIPVVVEVPHPFGPQGAKGFAEGPSIATAPAIANAIFDAIGVRLTSLPMRKEKVLAAIKAGQKSYDLH